MFTAVLSVRIREEVDEEAVRMGSVVEKALEEEIKRVKRERFKRLLEEVLKNMDLSAEDWVRVVKEYRLEM